MRSCCSHISNMMIGVTKGFEYKMKLVYAHFPINVAVSVTFSVLVVYDDGTTSDATNDLRISYRLSTGDAACGTFSGSTLTITTDAVCTSAQAVVEYTSFGAPSPLLNATSTVSVVTLSLELQIVGYPSYNQGTSITVGIDLTCSSH